MFCQHCGQEIGEAYVRRLIRDELRQLDPETTDKLTDQITARLARTQAVYRPNFETKILPLSREDTDGLK
jgi:hypothetical protein